MKARTFRRTASISGVNVKSIINPQTFPCLQSSEVSH
jgi:hypothetical protein